MIAPTTTNQTETWAFRDGPDCPWHGPLDADRVLEVRRMGFEVSKLAPERWKSNRPRTRIVWPNAREWSPSREDSPPGMDLLHETVSPDGTRIQTWSGDGIYYPERLRRIERPDGDIWWDVPAGPDATHGGEA